MGVDAPYDVVMPPIALISDQNLSAVKVGCSGSGVRQGGSLIIAAACEDGVPSHGRYAALLAEAGLPRHPS
jgi:hypothetical protein